MNELDTGCKEAMLLNKFGFKKDRALHEFKT